MTEQSQSPEIAAECLGVKVPASDFLNDKRIERINAARYEGQEIAGALHVVCEDDVVLEIGAGIGVVGAVVALNRSPKSVHSYEANPNLIPTIRALYAANSLEDRISVQNTVLISGTDRPDTIPFYVHNSYLGSSLDGDPDRAMEKVDIATADFATVCDDLKPTVLIMDIEGGELELLRHADLAAFRAIVLEFHPGAYGKEGVAECKTILKSAGFAKVDKKSTRFVWTCERAAQSEESAA
ncbi:FkbM family methyltransferase [Falsiphaeobacter marinintestinus]|uniref:FkbM family methyltransferase n=1 Tax=Falsiphaeobacter marinintestinus TaxID=1492905 RepID=UPI0011B5639F|nr:FkbM family methyltransferase [Phaeobacter marinintestinus]